MPVSEFMPARSAADPDPDPEPTAVVVAQDLIDAVDLSETEAARLAPVASAMVDKYAPSAPLVLRREAAIRVAGWLADSPPSNLRSSTIGPVNFDFAPSQRGAMLHSGAKSLLYPYRMKTAGVAR